MSLIVGLTSSACKLSAQSDMLCGTVQLAKAPARPCYSPQRTKPRSHSLVDKLARAFSGQSIAESEPMYGNVWVYVNDQNGRRYSLSVRYFIHPCTH